MGLIAEMSPEIVADAGERLTRQVNTSWNHDEYEKLATIAQLKGVPVARLVRDLAREKLTAEMGQGQFEMSRTEQVLLMAIRELHQVYMRCMKSAVNKELSAARLTEIESQSKLQRQELLVAYIQEFSEV